MLDKTRVLVAPRLTQEKFDPRPMQLVLRQFSQVLLFRVISMLCKMCTVFMRLVCKSCMVCMLRHGLYDLYDRYELYDMYDMYFVYDGPCDECERYDSNGVLFSSGERRSSNIGADEGP